MYGLLAVSPYTIHFIDVRFELLRWMFDACRIPGPQADWGISYAKDGDKGDSGHVIVLRKGRVWKIDAWQGGQLLSTGDIQA